MPPNTYPSKESIPGPGPGHIWDDYRAEDRLQARLPVHRSRIRTARRVVTEWLQRCERPYIAVSGGKDSVAMLHLVQSVAVPLRGLLPVMWHDSGVEWPGVPEAFDRLRSAHLVDELVIVRPQADVLDLKRQQLAGEISAAKKDRLALFDPIRSAVEQHGFDGFAVGLRGEESAARLRDRRTHGMLYQQRAGLLRCTPLAYWTWSDVFAYIAAYQLPLHPIYSAPLLHRAHRGEIRLSWWASTDYHELGVVQWVRRAYPAIYARLVEALPEVSRLA